MNISGNIIHFPVSPVFPVRHEQTEQEPSNIVGFPTQQADENAALEMQERGQVFAAHRIVARVADQLDSVVAL